jgi:hypothetical protein
LSYVDNPVAFDPRDLLRNEMGLPSCIRTTPRHLSLASASNMNGLVKYGRAKIGAEQRALLIS